MRKKRHRKRRPVVREKSNYLMKFVPIVAIIVVAILLGYGTARYVVGPACGYDLADLKFNFISDNEEKESTPKEQEKEERPEKLIVKEDAPKTQELKEGYALQFGFFSQETKAKTTQKKLQSHGIETTITKEDDGYKVMGETFGTKEEALDALNNIDKNSDIDVFIKKITKGN